MQSFFRELRGEFHSNDNRKLCINRNTHAQQEQNKKPVKKNFFGRTFTVEDGQSNEFTTVEV